MNAERSGRPFPNGWFRPSAYDVGDSSPVYLMWQALERMWQARACLVCGNFGNCGHREPEIDLAFLRTGLTLAGTGKRRTK